MYMCGCIIADGVAASEPAGFQERQLVGLAFHLHELVAVISLVTGWRHHPPFIMY